MRNFQNTLQMKFLLHVCTHSWRFQKPDYQTCFCWPQSSDQRTRVPGKTDCGKTQPTHKQGTNQQRDHNKTVWPPIFQLLIQPLVAASYCCHLLGPLKNKPTHLLPSDFMIKTSHFPLSEGGTSWNKCFVSCSACSCCRLHPHSLLQQLKDNLRLSAPNLTLYFSFANNTEALWNLHSGFLGSMLMALFRVSKAFSDFFSACCTCNRTGIKPWKGERRKIHLPGGCAAAFPDSLFLPSLKPSFLPGKLMLSGWAGSHFHTG